MKLQGGVRAFIFLIALYGATYTLSEPPPVRSFALLAQASVPGELEQPCLKGHEYWVGIGQAGLKITVTKKPPLGVPESSLPPGVVRYSDGKGGYISRACKEGGTVVTSIPLSDKLDFGDYSASAKPLSEVLQATPQTDSGSGSFTSGLYNNESGSLVPGGALQNIPFQNPVSTEGVQLSSEFTPSSIGDIDRQIQTDALQNIQNDPALRDNAFQMRLCQQQGTCEMGTLESSNPWSTEQQLRGEAQQAVQKDYFSAIKGAYGPGYAVDPLGDASVARVSQSDWGARYYDNDTGQPFLGKQSFDSAPTIIKGDGSGFSMSGSVSAWEGAMQDSIDSPTKFNALEAEYFDRGNTPNTYTPTVEGNEVIAHGACPTCDKLVPRDGFNAVRLHGDVVYGTADTAIAVKDMTGGKVMFDPPYSFPSETDVWPRNATSFDFTQLSSADRAAAINAVAQDIEKYPPSYWQNANPVNVYTYGYTPEATERALSSGVVTGGYSDESRSEIWLNGSKLDPNNKVFDPAAFSTTIHHELAHYNDAQLFGSDAKFAYAVYGPQYGSAYGGQSGLDAQLSGKFERPEGFAREYGYVGGIGEDKATVVESMFRNYGAVETAMQTDTALAAKVALAKQGFSNISNGDMDDAYWKNLKPISPNFALPPTPAQALLDSLTDLKNLNKFLGAPEK